MEKKTYYISVESGVILEDGSANEYEFIIQADQNEIHRLQELFDNTHQMEMDTLIPAMNPYIQYHTDPANHAYSDSLKEVYRMLHQLGTEETKKHIETMGIL